MKLNYSKIILIILAMISIYIFIQWISLKMNYKPLFTWWKNYDGKDYDKYFNLSTMLCARYSSILYTLSNMTNPPLKKFTMSQYLFIMNRLLPYIKYTDDNSIEHGILTPSNLCGSLLFSTKSQDIRYNTWYQQTNPTRGSNKYQIMEDLPKKLSYKSGQPQVNPNPKNKNQTFYFYEVDESSVNILKDSNKKYVTPYPSPEDSEGWKGLILEWLNGGCGPVGPDGNPALWCYSNDSSDNLIKLIINPTLSDTSNPTKYWLKSTFNDQYDDGEADNFMSRFGILPDSPIFVYWFNNNYSDGNMKVDTTSFHRLLGSTSANAGGWVGFLQNEMNWNEGEYQSLIDSQTGYTPPTPPPVCKPPNTTKGILSGIGTAISLGIMAALPGVGEAVIPILGAAVVGGVISGFNASGGTC